MGAGEMCTRDYHPYKYGYGKLMFSGYHFVDLLMWLLSINDEERTHPPPSRFSVQCGRFGPRDALAQTDGDRLEVAIPNTRNANPDAPRRTDTRVWRSRRC